MRNNFHYRKVVFIFLDLLIILLTAMFFTLEASQNILNINVYKFFIYNFLLLVFIFEILTVIFKFYKVLWRYADFEDFFAQSPFFVLYFTSFYISHTLIFNSNVNFWQAFIPTGTSFFLILLVRGIFRYRIYFNKKKIPVDADQKRVMVVGAGMAGSILITEMRNNPLLGYLPVCVIDDNATKTGKYIRNVPVIGTSQQISDNCDKFKIEIIFIAIPSCSKEEIRHILNECSKTTCIVKKLPDLSFINDNIKELIRISEDVPIEDLLERDTVCFDVKEVESNITNKTILVTGGGGSIGSELCRQIATMNPKHLIILDIYENNAYEIQQELIHKYGDDIKLTIEIASVRDLKKLDYIYNKRRPDIVFHAAAHKHVPLMEDNPEEAIKNNIIGTFNAATMADYYKTEKFILISTDKAVNPTSVMGATKRVAEMIIQNLSQTSKTKFTSVRFGNVLGSNGSVVPVFKKQIKNGGPITITHPDIIRYFMTIPEAVNLVLQTAAFAEGGEIFVLDMGKPVKINDLAEKLIRLSGLVPYKDIEIKYVGLRPGEKLYEELLTDDESLCKTSNNRILVGKQHNIDSDLFIKKLTALQQASNSNNSAICIELIKSIVDTYVVNRVEELHA